MYVCLCTGMNCRQVKGAMAEGARTPAQIFLHNGVRPNCGRCRPTIVEMLGEHNARADSGAEPTMTPLAAGLAAAE